jgi:hypothetical protein
MEIIFKLVSIGFVVVAGPLIIVALAFLPGEKNLSAYLHVIG